MVKDYIGGWLDSRGIFVVCQKQSGVYPIIRILAPDWMIGLLMENFGGHTRPGVWEINKKAEAIQLLKQMKDFVVGKKAELEAMIDVLQSKGPSRGPLLERFRRLQAGETEE